MRSAAEAAAVLTFEFHGVLRRLAGGGECTIAVEAPLSLADALAALADARPELAATLGRSACAIGDRLLLRREMLAGGERIALLPPVAGG